MKKVGIDARLIRQTGVGVYIRNFLLHLPKYISANWQIMVYLTKEDMGFELPASFIKRQADYRWHSFSEQTGFYNMLQKDALDLMHFTYFSYPVRYKNQFIATIHDLTPYLFKTGLASTKNRMVYDVKHMALRHVLKKQIANAQYVVTPTATVKKEITDNFRDVYAGKIVPIYEGVDSELTKLKEKKPNIQLPDNYLLYIGNFYPHKNVQNLIKAFAKVEADISLVLIGPKDLFAHRLSQLIEYENFSKKVIFYHNATREEIVYFYKHAKVLVHPTLVEGFGLTLLEGAYFNLPIIASKIPVFEEVYHGYYTPFNPKSVSDIASTINTYLKNPKSVNYAPLLKRYSFDTMTKEITDIYKKILG